jgi:hypothetical protein
VSAGLHTVHVRVNDAATGQPTPVRLRIADAEGFSYAPFGRLTNFALGPNEDVGGNVLIDSLPYAYIDGTCEIRVPTGPLLIEIDKGPEYQPLRRQVQLGIGQMALRFAFERWIDLRKEGWYSGDAHAEFMTPHAALLEAAAEDLAVVNLLARPTSVVSALESTSPEGAASGPSLTDHPAISNILAFSGQRPALEMPGHMVVVNTHNSHPVLGSLGLLNCHRPVYPLTFGGDAGPDDWSLADWCEQCHRKGGLVIWTQAWHEKDGLSAGEALADLILGRIDALEIGPSQTADLDRVDDWYRLLNGGCQIPIVGGSGKNSNRTVLGSVRTYARLQPGEELTYKNWIEAIRRGRTFVTNGPLLSFTVNGQEPGAVLDLSSAVATVHLYAQVRSALPFERLEIVANGQVVKSADTFSSPGSRVIDADLALPQGGWLAARCLGARRRPERNCPGLLAAHTSPIYVQIEGQRMRPDAEAANRLVDLLNASLDWVHNKARFENEKQRRHLAGIFEAALMELARRRTQGPT